MLGPVITRPSLRLRCTAAFRSNQSSSTTVLRCGRYFSYVGGWALRNQLFGDVYDYVKYGLIRRLTNYGDSPSVVCWMMREDEENNNDGKHIGYLEDLDARKFEPEVFDLLLTERDRGERDVRIIERSGLLANVRFFSRRLTDDMGERVDYFEEFFNKAKPRGLVLFDADTGLQGDSTPKPGKLDSSKYLMRDEAVRAFNAKHSLLVFVNRATVESREYFINRTLHNLHPVDDATYLVGILYQNAGFFLVPQPQRIDEYEAILRQAAKDWPALEIVAERI